MKTLLYILQKEFRQILRNRTILPMIVVVPLIQLLVLVYAATFELKKIEMTVVDRDLSPASRGMVTLFNGIPFFRVDGNVAHEKAGEELLLKGQTDVVLVIPAGFEKSLMREDQAQVQLLIDAIDGNTAQLIYTYCNSILFNYNKQIIANWKGLPDFNPPTEVVVTENYWFNPELDYKWFMAPGILSILVTIIGMFLSGMNLVREKEYGTIEQLNVTPVKKYQFILGKLIPFWIIALFDLALGLGIARILFDLPLTGSLPLLFGFAGVYLISALGLGLFISTITDTQQQVMFVTFFFMMLFILMGGIFTPVESMPQWAQVVNHLNPISYFMRIMRMIILKGSGFSDLLREFISLVILGILFLTLAIWRYRKTA